MHDELESSGIGTMRTEIQTESVVEILWAARFRILLMVLACSGLSLWFTLLMPDVYESRALLGPKDTSTSGGDLSQLASRYAGLASMAGINLGNAGGGNSRLPIALETIKSKSFFERYLYEFMLIDLMAMDGWDIEKLENKYDSSVYDFESKSWVRKVSLPFRAKPSVSEAYEVFVDDVLKIETDRTTEFIVVKIRHKSPKLSQQWLRFILTEVDKHIRDKDIREAKETIVFLEDQRKTVQLVTIENVFAQLIEEKTKTMILAGASADYVFSVLDGPSYNEFSVGPNRLIIVGLISMFVSILCIAWYIFEALWTQKLSLHLKESEDV
jgi:hypothetical protein